MKSHDKYIKSYVVVVPVRGLPFPIDMLRYDVCAPAREEDSNAIVRSVTGGHLDADFVVLATFDRGAPRLNRARWLAYGWDVVIIETSENLHSCVERAKIHMESLWRRA